MVRRADHIEESIMHRVNGYVTIGIYVILALACIITNFKPLYLPLWVFGFLLHYLKLVLVKKRLAVKYGGYMGGILLLTWLALIFTHLPS